MTVNVGLIGLGFMGKTHLEVYGNLGNVKVVAVADQLIERANQVASQIDGRAYELQDELMEDPKVDMVDICLPTHLHAETAVKAADSGKHILCEKPISLDLGEADKMISAARRNNVKFMVAHVIRFWPEYRMLTEMKEAGELGMLRSLVCVRLSARPAWAQGNWIIDERKSGSAALDLHIHDTDYVLYLLGRPASVLSAGTVEHIQTIYNYGDGVLVSAEGGWDLPEKFPFVMSYRAVFDRGAVEFFSNRTPTLIAYEDGKEPRAPQVPMPPIRAEAVGGNISAIAGYYNEIKYFVDCVESNERPAIVTPSDARAALEVTLAEIASLRTRKTMALGDIVPQKQS